MLVLIALLVTQFEIFKFKYPDRDKLGLSRQEYAKRIADIDEKLNKFWNNRKLKFGIIVTIFICSLFLNVFVEAKGTYYYDTVSHPLATIKGENGVHHGGRGPSYAIRYIILTTKDGTDTKLTFSDYNLLCERVMENNEKFQDCYVGVKEGYYLDLGPVRLSTKSTTYEHYVFVDNETRDSLINDFERTYK